MTLFSKVRNARKAAEEHKKAASAQAASEKPPAPPYKHIPTHAAQDALAGSSSIWSREERSQLISAAHKRRNDLKMISVSFGGSSGNFHSEIDQSKIAQVRRMNHNISGSSSMLNVPAAGSSRASLNLLPSTSAANLYHGINDIGPSRASSSGYDNTFSPSAMARRQEQLSRSSLNEKTLQDAPPVHTVLAMHRQTPSPANNHSRSSYQTTHSSRASFQQRRSPLSTSDPSPVESSNSSFSSENSSSSSSALEMHVPAHSSPHAFQKPVDVPQATTTPGSPIHSPSHLSFPMKAPLATVSTVAHTDNPPVVTDLTAKSSRRSWLRRKR